MPTHRTLRDWNQIYCYSILYYSSIAAIDDKIGPLLLNRYTNNLSGVCESTTVVYADDSSMLYNQKYNNEYEKLLIM